MARIGVVVWMVILFLVLPFGRQVGRALHRLALVRRGRLLGGLLDHPVDEDRSWAWPPASWRSWCSISISWRRAGDTGRWSSSPARTTCPSSRAGARWSRSTGGSSCPAALVIAFMLSGQGTARWETMIRFRNAGVFGVTEPLFGRDVGFYVFTYPLLLGVVPVPDPGPVGDPGGGRRRVRALSRRAADAARASSSPRGRRGTSWAWAPPSSFVKAWGYSLDAFGLLFSGGRGVVRGELRGRQRAACPALYVMIGLAGLAAVLCLIQMTRPGLRSGLRRARPLDRGGPDRPGRLSRRRPAVPGGAQRDRGRAARTSNGRSPPPTAPTGSTASSRAPSRPRRTSPPPSCARTTRPSRTSACGSTGPRSTPTASSRRSAPTTSSSTWTTTATRSTGSPGR